MLSSLTFTERTGFGLATIMLRKGIDAKQLAPVIGFEPPAGAITAEHGDLRLVGTGPGQWLALAEEAAPDWAYGLKGELNGLASVSEQSSGYIVFRIAGETSRALLQRGGYIDLDNQVFRTGSAATTMIAHMGVILWQVEQTPVFELALFRSYAASFRHWFEVTAQGL